MKCRARIKEKYCKNDARKGFTTCSDHGHRERTNLRVGDRVTIDDSWPKGVGYSGCSGELLDYVAKPEKATPATSYVYARIKLDEGSTVLVPWTVITEEK